MSEMVVLVQQTIAKVCDLDIDRVRPESNLAELGVDSLAAAEVLVSLEMRLGKQLPVDVMRHLDDVQTVAQIAAHLDRAFADPTRS